MKITDIRVTRVNVPFDKPYSWTAGHALLTAALIVLANQASAVDFRPSISSQLGAWSWTGCYVGGHVGGLWGDSGKWIPRTPGGAFEGLSLGGQRFHLVPADVAAINAAMMRISRALEGSRIQDCL